MSNENYARPGSLNEAMRLLTEAHSLVLGGGTYLVRRQQGRRVQQLVDLSELGLNCLIDEPASVTCGPTVTLQELIESSLVSDYFGQVLIEAARLTRPSWMLRNMSTVGGELVEGARHCALAVAMLALDAQLTVTTLEGDRAFSLGEFYGEHAVQMASPFILSQISLPKMAGSARSVFRHLAQLPSQEPIAAAAISLQVDGTVIRWARVALGSAVPEPQRLYDFERALTGSSSEFDENGWRDLCETGLRGVEFASDHQRSAGYLREMSEVLLRRTYLGLLEGDG